MSKDDPKPWRYACYPSSTDSASFKALESIVTLWRSKWAHGVLPPAWSDFDFYEFEAWWGRLSMAEVRRHPFDIHFILWGTTLTRWWGVDYTKKSLAKKGITPDVWDAQEQHYFKALTDETLIGFAAGPLDQYGRGLRLINAVDLPLAKGGRVGGVLSAYVVVDDLDENWPAADPVLTF